MLGDPAAAGRPKDDRPGSVFVAFNQSATRMVTAGQHGFSLYQVPPPGTFQLLRTEQSLGPVSLVALIETVPLVAVVPSATDRILQLFDLRDKQVVSEIQFDAAIVKVLLNVSRLVVVLEHHVHIFDLNTMNSLSQYRPFPPNRRGVADLTGLMENGSCYLAFPHSTTPEQRGEVFIVDAILNHQIAAIPAHRSPVAAIAFNASGDMVATCSDKGTVIRVFSPTNHELLYTFRRGTSPASIYQLAFAPQGQLLSATSNSGTLHLFRCAKQRQGSAELRAFKKIPVRKTVTLCAIHTNAATLTVVTVPVPGEHSGLVAQYSVDGDNVNLVKELQLQASPA